MWDCLGALNESGHVFVEGPNGGEQAEVRHHQHGSTVGREADLLLGVGVCVRGGGGAGGGRQGKGEYAEAKPYLKPGSLWASVAAPGLRPGQTRTIVHPQPSPVPTMCPLAIAAQGHTTGVGAYHSGEGFRQGHLPHLVVSREHLGGGGGEGGGAILVGWGYRA